MKKMTIRLEPTDFEKIRQSAFDSRLPVSVWVRQTLTGQNPKKISAPVPGAVELLSVLQKVLSNLTQIRPLISPFFYSQLYSKFQGEGLKIKLGERSSDDIESISKKIRPLADKLNKFAHRLNLKQNINHMELLDLIGDLNEFIF